MQQNVQSGSLSSGGGLKSECLSFSHVLAQSVATISPIATPTLIVPIVFAYSQKGTWLSYLFATVVILLVTYHVNEFAARAACPGALHVFVSQGLGPMWGAIAGWSLVIAYLFTGSACLAGAASYSGQIADLFSVRSDWALTFASMLAVAGMSWWFAYRGIQISTRAMLLLEVISVTLLLSLAILFLFKRGRILDSGQFSLAQLSPNGVRQGLVLAIFSFVGFESATTLGHEAREPLKAIPRSMLTSVGIVGGFFMFMSYVIVLAFEDQSTVLAKSVAPLTYVAQITSARSFGVAIAVGVIISQFACALACINAAARIVYSMSLGGLLHPATAGTHKTNSTPHFAVSVLSVITTVVPCLLVLRHMALLDAFGYLGTLATFGFLFAYILIVLAATIFSTQRREVRVVPAVLSIATIALLSLPLVASFGSISSRPESYLPYVFLGLLLLGAARFGYLRITRGELLRVMGDRLGSMAVRQSSTGR
jgi:amino acid transporter